MSFSLILMRELGLVPHDFTLKPSLSRQIVSADYASQSDFGVYCESRQKVGFGET
jgi:hypothetical protein